MHNVVSHLTLATGGSAKGVDHATFRGCSDRAVHLLLQVLCMTAKQGARDPTPIYLELRKLSIIAMFSDDVLMERLVLKGGNALDIALGLGGRTSVDLDFSMERDFDDLEDIRRRVERAITDRFDSAGYDVFDLRLEPMPRRHKAGVPEEWGGYRIEFKVIQKPVREAFRGDRSRLFTQAEDVAPGFKKTMTIEISHHEYTKGSMETELDHHTIRVYTPAMIAIEKIRAICQQMPDYGLRGDGAPRARDFFDIQRISKMKGVRLDTEACGELLRRMFDAKRVPLGLLDKIGEHREFHRMNWDQVMASAREPLKAEDFDKCFDDVVDIVARLKVLRDE